MGAKRDVSGALRLMRRWFLQRPNTNFLRFQDETANRTQPPPNLPEGPNAKLSGNYYYSRDARRLVKPTETIMEGNKVLQLTEGDNAPKSVTCRVPGRVYNWDM